MTTHKSIVKLLYINFTLIFFFFISSCKDDLIQPPIKPYGVEALSGMNQITISWNESSGALGYNLYWSETPGFSKTNGTLIANVISPYVHTGLTFGKNYYYFVTAKNDGGESFPSSEVFGVPGCLNHSTGIVSWWSADGNANDIVGNNHGTLQGSVTYAPGKVGQAFNFTSNLDIVGAGVSGINNLQQLTIELWVQHRTITPNQIDHYFTIGGQTAKAVLRHDGVSGTNQLHFYMDINGQFYHVRANNVLQVGVWHHVVGTYDGNIMSLYIDGVLNGTNPISGTVATGEHISFGTNGIGFDGLIDETTIYNYALTSNEIIAIYNADIAGKCK